MLKSLSKKNNSAPNCSKVVNTPPFSLGVDKFFISKGQILMLLDPLIFLLNEPKRLISSFCEKSPKSSEMELNEQVRGPNNGYPRNELSLLPLE